MTEPPPTTPQAPPCFNNGQFCSGRGQCLNDTCVCDTNNATGVACEIVPTPPPKECKDLGAQNCFDCKIFGQSVSLNCSWCPLTNDTLLFLVNGTCGLPGECPHNKSLFTCQPPITIIPPTCPDNCTGNGVCVNLTTCDKLEKDNKRDHGDDTGAYLLSCGDNANKSREYNQTGACACFQGATGINCALIGKKSLVALAALGAGLIALIVILAIVAAIVAGGGAAAVGTGVGGATEGAVVNNPLHVPKDTNFENPLCSMENYEIL